MTSPPEVLRLVRAAVDDLRADLTARHGWTHIDVEASVQGDRRLVLTGEVVVDRVARAVRGRVGSQLPDGWSLDAGSVSVMRGGAWRRLLPGVHRLFARLDRETTGWGAWVELVERDSPVQILAEVDDMVLVRGRDATTGWLQGGLGDVTPAVPITAPDIEDPWPMISHARERLCAQYVLGGATSTAIDCSALIQQAADAIGLLLPRHSSDQLQIDPQDGHASEAGDLVFTWNEREALCHVGLVTGSTVVHASRSRGLVVEDPLDEFEIGSRRLMHVPFSSLLAFGRRVAGTASLSDAGFELGRAPPPPAKT